MRSAYLPLLSFMAEPVFSCFMAAPVVLVVDSCFIVAPVVEVWCFIASPVVVPSCFMAASPLVAEALLGVALLLLLLPQPAAPTRIPTATNAAANLALPELIRIDPSNLGGRGQARKQI
jgi:hypothetical protein